MSNNIHVYILIMFIVSSLLRILPLTLLRREIKNERVRAFFYYVPYVTLAVMTVPAIMQVPQQWTAGLAALLIGTIAALRGTGVFLTAILCSVIVFALELVL